LNIAFGSGSTTTAITSIASSLLIQLLKPVSRVPRSTVFFWR
jgi:hypothetical protein